MWTSVGTLVSLWFFIQLSAAAKVGGAAIAARECRLGLGQMRGVRLTLNECHRNWRFYKLWLLIGLSCAVLAIKAATGKRGQEEHCYKAWKVYRAKDHDCKKEGVPSQASEAIGLTD
jgi:hypothetical protein